MALAASHGNPDKAKRKPKYVKKMDGTFGYNIEAYSKVEHLIDLVYCDLLNGETTYHVIKKLMEGAYEGLEKGYSLRQSQSYLAAARERIKNDFEQKEEDARSLLMGRFESVYNDSQVLGDHHAAIRALENLGKILGVYNNEKPTIQVSGNEKGITINFGFASDNNEEKTEENPNGIQ